MSLDEMNDGIFAWHFDINFADVCTSDDLPPIASPDPLLRQRITNIACMRACAILKRGATSIPKHADHDNELYRFYVAANAFNLAMAKWGQNGEPNTELFQRVVDLEDTQSYSKQFNYVQCLAIAHYVVGNVEEAERRLKKAKRLLAQRPRRKFSAWSFDEETPNTLREHLAEMQKMISGKNVVPEVVTKGPVQYKLH